MGKKGPYSETLDRIRLYAYEWIKGKVVNGEITHFLSEPGGKMQYFTTPNLDIIHNKLMPLEIYTKESVYVKYQLLVCKVGGTKTNTDWQRHLIMKLMISCKQDNLMSKDMVDYFDEELLGLMHNSYKVNAQYYDMTFGGQTNVYEDTTKEEVFDYLNARFEQAKIFEKELTIIK